MRQADINRVNKAKEHLKAASILLSNIKWENRSSLEDDIIKKSCQQMKSADMYLDDLVNIQEVER